MPKPYAKLTRADLQQSPIWEWVQDEGSSLNADDVDESFVQPMPLERISTATFAQYVVAATIELKDGSIMPGIAEVTVADDKMVVQPTVFLVDRHLSIPSMETNRLLSRYTKAVENYPVGWKLTVMVEGETEMRSGKIAGGDMKDLVAVGMQVLLSLKSLRDKK